jgi:STE24 endopeptidase
MIAFEDIPFLEATVVFLTATYIFEMYLQFRQHLKLNESEIPDELKGIVTQDVFDKARAYSRDKSWFTFANSTFDHIETVVCVQTHRLAVVPWAVAW